MNKLASIEVVAEIVPHENAEKLEIARVLGFEAIVPKGKYKAGDTIVFIWPDVILPEAEWSSFYRAKSSRTKAVKLRGVWSMGIVEDPENVGYFGDLEEGLDVGAEIGITKWEPPAPQDMQAKTSCLPYGIGKTDETNFQGIRANDMPYGEFVDITLKRDGSSVTIYYNIDDDQWGITSRSQELKPECDNKYTRSVLAAVNIEWFKKYCLEHGVSLCLRGEAFGDGLNAHSINPDAKEKLQWEMFNVYNIKEHRYYKPHELHYFENVGKELGIKTVPILEKQVILTKEKVQHYSSDITELNGKPFEGVVVKHNKGSFKIINKTYDSKK